MFSINHYNLRNNVNLSLNSQLFDTAIYLDILTSLLLLLLLYLTSTETVLYIRNNLLIPVCFSSSALLLLQYMK